MTPPSSYSDQAKYFWRAAAFIRIDSHPAKHKAVSILKSLTASEHPPIQKRAIELLETLTDEQLTRKY